MRKGQLTLVEVELVEDLDLMATRISGAGWRADNSETLDLRIRASKCVYVVAIDANEGVILKLHMPIGVKNILPGPIMIGRVSLLHFVRG